MLDAVAPNTATSSLLMIAGLLLGFGAHAGLDVLALPVLVAIAGGVASAWLLLTKIPSNAALVPKLPTWGSRDSLAADPCLGGAG